MTLRIGHIDYLNCAPFFSCLSRGGPVGSIITGSPAQLNTLLAAGQIDVCPASSFEYGRHWSDYLLLPDLSISACGPVKSVLLFAHRPLAELDGSSIALTGESATSVNLLQILLREHCGFDAIRLSHPVRPVEEVIADGGAGLLIGDRALKAAQAKLAPYQFDLGSLWQAFSGLPFVFALWMVRRAVVETRGGEVARLLSQLRAGFAQAMQDLPNLALQLADRTWMPADELLAYWRTMSYRLSDVHQQGLELFFRLAVKHRLLPAMPELHFFEPPFSVDASRGID